MPAQRSRSLSQQESSILLPSVNPFSLAASPKQRSVGNTSDQHQHKECLFGCSSGLTKLTPPSTSFRSTVSCIGARCVSEEALPGKLITCCSSLPLYLVLKGFSDGSSPEFSAMADTDISDLVNVLKSSKQIFWNENVSLSESERQRLWDLRIGYLASSVGANPAHRGQQRASSSRKRAIPRTLSMESPTAKRLERREPVGFLRPALALSWFLV